MDSIKEMVFQICRAITEPKETAEFKEGVSNLAREIINKMGLQERYNCFATNVNRGFLLVDQKVSIVDRYTEKCYKNGSIRLFVSRALQKNRKIFAGYLMDFVANRVAVSITKQVNANYRPR